MAFYFFGYKIIFFKYFFFILFVLGLKIFTILFLLTRKIISLWLKLLKYPNLLKWPQEKLSKAAKLSKFSKTKKQWGLLDIMNYFSSVQFFTTFLINYSFFFFFTLMQLYFITYFFSKIKQWKLSYTKPMLKVLFNFTKIKDSAQMNY